ncbi:hypothetical protein [Microlunatus speluncae]|uniref:hypothetical protein n=1 Tax=Microlunatus speluncae TaxID=2594267 RepID=UPI00126636DF|nr:hypothetical protein [Microlunatus speluncae]
MTESSVEALAVPYDTQAADERVARRRQQLRMRLISLGITVVVMIVFYLWQGRSMSGGLFIAGYVLVFAVALGWLAFCWIGLRIARQERAEVGQGTALRIDRVGVELAGTFAAWPQIVGLAAVKGGFLRAERLQLNRTDGEPVSVAFEAMPVRPATIDQTARAYSAGRHGVDLSELES